MAVIHDTYAFDADAFAAEAGPLLERGNPAALRTAALAAYDADGTARTLAEHYGGWDRDALATEPADDEAFWLLPLLYRRLRALDPPAGLGGGWRDLEQEAGALGLTAADARLLVRGRSLAELDMPGEAVLREVRPASTAGIAGWLNEADVHRVRVALGVGGGGPPALRSALERMLTHAPVCVIVSG